MAFASGVSIQGAQIVVQGVAGEFDRFFLYLPDPQYVRPVRVGYYWYGAGTSDLGVGFLFDNGPVTTWGAVIERAKQREITYTFDTLIVDWNAPGVAWQAFW